MKNLTLEQRAEAIAERLLQIKAIKLSPQNPFTWASGIKSPIYCDNRILLSYPDIRSQVIDSMVALSETFQSFDTIAGVATAGIPHGALLAQALNLPFIYVRSKAKEHGRQNQIEGELKPGSKILVIEDLISTGGSVLKATDALIEAGGNIAGVMAIFTYGFSTATSRFEEKQITFKTISDYDTLIKIAAEKNYISSEEAQSLSTWRKDPKNWFQSV